MYEKVSGLRDAEQGKGPELAKPEDIEKPVDLKKIAAYYAAMKSYASVVGFMPDTPEEVKNRILFTRDPRYQELAQIANPLISGSGWSSEKWSGRLSRKR